MTLFSFLIFRIVFRYGSYLSFLYFITPELVWNLCEVYGKPLRLHLIGACLPVAFGFKPACLLENCKKDDGFEGGCILATHNTAYVLVVVRTETCGSSLMIKVVLRPVGIEIVLPHTLLHNLHEPFLIALRGRFLFR